MQEERVTLACAAPTVLVTLATFAGARTYRLVPGVRIGTGGAAPAAAVLRNMEALGIEVIHLYGLTETGPFLTSCEWQPAWNDIEVATRYRMKARQGISQLLTDNAGDGRADARSAVMARSWVKSWRVATTSWKA
jgi:fatty-acyl-CoA synthase